MGCLVSVNRWDAVASMRDARCQADVATVVVPESRSRKLAAVPPSYNVVVVVTVPGTELHVVLFRVVDRGVEWIAGVSCASTHMDCVTICFAVDGKGVVFNGIPFQVVLELHFDSHPIGCVGGGQLVHSFETEPEVTLDVTKAGFVFSEGYVVVEGVADLLMKDYPPVDY